MNKIKQERKIGSVRAGAAIFSGDDFMEKVTLQECHERSE